MHASVAVKEDEVYRALRDLGGGLEREDLLVSACYGEWERASCHRFDTGVMKRLAPWNGRMKSLRTRLDPKGWTSVEDHGGSFVLSPDRKIAINTARGDEHTGNPDRNPKTQFQKGIVTATLARQNCGQLNFDGIEAVDGAAPKMAVIPVDAVIYTLLCRREGEQMHAELSAPLSVDSQGYATFVRPRIIFGAFPLGQRPAGDTLSDDSLSDIDIDVTPRGDF